MKKTFHTIYLLVDPRDHKPFYIGQTTNIKLRYYRQHWNPKDDDKTDRANQIREILKAGRKPNLVILERTTRKVSALMREMFWIETFKRSGVKLKNRESQQWLLKQYDELTKQLRQKQPSANWHPRLYGVGYGYMATAIKTKYVNGVFQPLEKVNIPEGLNVTVRIEDTLPTIDNESRQWLNQTAEDLADRLAELEDELPKDEVANWHKAMYRASKPARYVAGKGVVIEQ